MLKSHEGLVHNREHKNDLILISYTFEFHGHDESFDVCLKRYVKNI